MTSMKQENIQFNNNDIESQLRELIGVRTVIDKNDIHSQLYDEMISEKRDALEASAETCAAQ